MSKYLDGLGPEAKLGEVFDDLHAKAKDAVGKEGAALSSGSGAIDIPETALELKLIETKGTRFRNTAGGATILINALEGEDKVPLIAVSDREENMRGRSDHVPRRVSATGRDDWFPTYSIECNVINRIILQQLADPNIAEEALGSSPQGSSSGEADETVGSLDPEHSARLVLVTSVIVRNLRMIELMREGNTMSDAHSTTATEVAKGELP